MLIAGMPRVAALVVALLTSLAVPARAVSIDWVTVGDPGNAADTGAEARGAVATSYQVMRYEFTNQQYAEFLNSVAATDTYSLYNASMGSDPRGGITRIGTSGSYTYAIKSNMGDKPVNFVSWFDAARVANWLMNGATGTSSTETGAYTLSGTTSGDAVTVNPGASYFLPTQDQWYKAAYYKGSGTNAGYWDYATQSDTAPTAVSAGTTGIGSAGSTGNFANFDSAAIWNSRTGNVTTVGTNGGGSAYGAFDLSGNILEWNDVDVLAALSSRGLRGGAWGGAVQSLSSSDSIAAPPSIANDSIGFRLASPVAVPEPSTCASLLAGLACGGYAMFRRRKRA